MKTNKLDIKEFLNQDQKKDLLRLLTAGSVDDGKSTLIGRLMYDSKMLYDDQLSALKRDSKRIGHAGEEIDYALLLDGLKAEREQGITIDVAYRFFSTAKRKFIIADTPGHEQYTRNMITGGSTANLAIILIDARKGVIIQTKRHTFLTSLLGIKHVVVAVNKMDLVDYSQAVFEKIKEDYTDFVDQLDIPDVTFIPLSALKGENVVERSKLMPWYDGESMLEFLENVHIDSDRNFKDLRYPVQFVLRPDIKFRGFSASVASGVISKGDEIMVLPSMKRSKVKSIVTYDGDLDYAFPPQSVTVTLEDEIDISRGDMIVHPDNVPSIGRQFECTLVWMDETEMDLSTQFYIKQANNSTMAHISEIKYKIDVNSLEKLPNDKFQLNEIGRVVLTTNKPLFFDAYKKNKETGSFILIDPVTNNTCAVGMIIDKYDSNLSLSEEDKLKISKGLPLVSSEDYVKKYNQKGATIWLKGESCDKKNELVCQLHRSLFNMGTRVVLLDENTTLSGLSTGLDMTQEPKATSLRRIANIAALLNKQGIITVCSFVSMGVDLKQDVESIIGGDNFHLFNTDLLVGLKEDSINSLLNNLINKGVIIK
ncbi:MAG: sulfate adenylyltransferase subunit CysN [Bacteroidales bacterium]